MSDTSREDFNSMPKQTMSIPSTKKEVNGNGSLDLISQLSDDILFCIISSLSIDDAVRTSVLSKRWIHLRNNVFHFDFDWTHMFIPSPKIYFGISFNKYLKSLATEKHARKYSEIVNTILHQYIGDYLISCCFKHLHQNVSLGHLKTWVEFVVERKKLSSLSLECDSPTKIGKIFKRKIFSNLCSLELTNYKFMDSILPAFESCEKLKILKLKKISMVDSIINGILENCFGLEKFCLIESDGFDSLKIENKNLKYLELLRLNVKEIDVNVEELHVVVINFLICPPKGLRIYSQNLWNFSYTCNSIPQPIKSRNILQTRQIFESCSNLLVYKPTDVFRNLLTLSIDLDLNNIRDVLVFSYILTTCFHLNTLEITIPVKKALVSSTTSNDCALPYPKSMFWEKREVPNFIFSKLKFVTLKEFTGKELEVSFAKFLITNACMMKRLYVICNSTIVEEAKDLPSLPSASNNLSIILKSKI